MQVINTKEMPEIIETRIEKLSNLGLGVAKLDGYVIFVENACPEDYVKIEITKRNKNFANAKIVEIIKPSPYRTEPFCKMQKVCGACQIQFIEYSKQLEYKKEIVSDAMRSIYGYGIEVKDVIPSPEIREYRKKIQYPISETRDSKRIIAGYYKPNSHELVNIKHCPIQPEYCDKIIEFIREKAPLCKVNGYREREHKGLLRHVVIRTSAYNSKSLVILVANTQKISESLLWLADKIYNELPDITGVAINYNDKKTNLILSEKTEIIKGEGFVEERLCDKIFKIAPKTFFQVNPLCADNIFRYVKKYISEKFVSPKILDAYAGISAFGICLSDIASKVVTVEEVRDSVELAQKIISENDIQNVEAKCFDAGKFFEVLVKTGEKFDVTVLDPPRKGCSKETLDYALKITNKTIVYVSCNPATLARDLKYLKEHGAKIETVQPFDMFPHTYHIENVVFVDISDVRQKG